MVIVCTLRGLAFGASSGHRPVSRQHNVQLLQEEKECKRVFVTLLYKHEQYWH